MQVAGITFEWNGSHIPYQPDQATPPREAWTARLLEATTRTQLNEIIGKTVENPDGVLCRVLGVESFATEHQPADRYISLLLDPLEKPF